MNVFTDFHHQALLYSLVLLFEKKLGGNLYRPIGLDWFNEGFWNVYPHPATAAQYLSLDQEYKPTDGSPPLNQIIKQEEGIYLCNDLRSSEPNKAITLEKFKNMKFDIIIASIPQHVPLFTKLRDLYQPQAKLIMQVGNAWTFDSGFPIKNILASTAIPTLPGFNQVTYHQEFSLETFHYEPVKNNKKIYSFINCLGVVDLYKEDWELFLELERLMPDWEFKSFGGQCRDGSIGETSVLADKMREATFIYQSKRSGDGFGHNIFSAAAVGRPLITRFSDYQGKLAEPLITPFTSVIIDGRTPEEIAETLEALYYLTNEAVAINSTLNIDSMSNNIYQKFKENVDFDKEAESIKEFLSKLI